MYHPVVKVVNIKKMDPSAYNIYIGRKSHISAKVLSENPLLIDGTSLGNPFPIGDGCTREQAIESYRHYFYNNRGLFEGLLCNLIKEAKRRTVF